MNKYILIILLAFILVGCTKDKPKKIDLFKEIYVEERI